MVKVDLQKYFDIVSSKQKDKIKVNISQINNPLAVPFVGRKATNNGISDYVLPDEQCINEGGVITIALDGSTGSTFYQHHQFCSGQNIWLLKPKTEYLKQLDPIIALFLTTTIQMAVKKYSYNLSLTKERLSKIKILLPLNDDETINIDYIRKTMNQLKNIQFLKHILPKRY